MESFPTNTSTSVLPMVDANSNVIIFNSGESIGIGVRLYSHSSNVAAKFRGQIHGAVGGISALMTLLLLFHIFMVAAVRRGEAGKVNGEKVRVPTSIVDIGTNSAHCTLGLLAHQAGRLLHLSSHRGPVDFLWAVYPVSGVSYLPRHVATHLISLPEHYGLVSGVSPKVLSARHNLL